MEEEKTNIQVSTVMSRLLAAAVDLTLVLFLSVFGSSLAYRIAQNTNGELKTVINLQYDETSSSHLAKTDSKGNHVSYTSDEYFEKTENGYKIIDALAYFYTVYLAGDTKRASSGDSVSPSADKEMVAGEEKVTPRSYYTVEWFNTNVLELPKEGQEAKYNYFTYQKDGENNDYTKIGTVSEAYIEVEVVGEETISKINASDEMINFVYEKYKAAVNTFANQEYMTDYSNKITNINQLITLICRLSFIFIFLEIIPFFLKGGKTLGKLFMRLHLVNMQGEPVKKWQILVRPLLYFAIPIILYFVPNLIIQIASILVLLIATIVLMATNKKNRLCLHDYFARTIVVEDVIEQK